MGTRDAWAAYQQKADLENYSAQPSSREEERMSTKQASLYAAAKEVLDKSLPLLDGLHPSNPDANLEQVAAMKTAVENHLSDLVNEIGLVRGPRTAGVNQYFSLLQVNTETGAFPSATLIADPERSAAR